MIKADILRLLTVLVRHCRNFGEPRRKPSVRKKQMKRLENALPTSKKTLIKDYIPKGGQAIVT